jgi:hypothetical protein
VAEAIRRISKLRGIRLIKRASPVEKTSPGNDSVDIPVSESADRAHVLREIRGVSDNWKDFAGPEPVQGRKKWSKGFAKPQRSLRLARRLVRPETQHATAVLIHMDRLRWREVVFGGCFRLRSRTRGPCRCVVRCRR